MHARCNILPRGPGVTHHRPRASLLAVCGRDGRSRLQVEMPGRDDLQERHWRRVGERKDLAGELKLATPLEHSDARVAVQARRETNRGCTLVVDVSGDRLRDDTVTRGDLVQIQMPHVVLE